MQIVLELVFALAAGLVSPLLQETATQAKAGEWTAPGWYVMEYQGDGSPNAIRAGPFRDRITCTSFRARTFAGAPPGHPELDNLACSELAARPSP